MTKKLCFFNRFLRSLQLLTKIASAKHIFVSRRPFFFELDKNQSSFSQKAFFLFKEIPSVQEQKKKKDRRLSLGLAAKNLKRDAIISQIF